MKLAVVMALGGALLASSAGAAPQFVLPAPVQVAPLATNATPQPVGFARAAFQIPEGKVWAHEGSFLACGLINTPVKWSATDWELDTGRLRAVFREETARAGFRPPENVNLFETGPSPDRFQLAALITDMEGRFCGNYNVDPSPYSGRMRLTIEWQLYDTFSREVVRRISVTAGGQEPRMSTDGVSRTFYAAFREGVRALLADEAYRAAVTSQGAAMAPPVLTPIRFTAAAIAKQPIAKSAEAVVAVFGTEGHGTGFLISSDGYLLTNHHVVGEAKYVKIRWPDRSETLGEVVRSDRRRDVALVKVDAGGRRPLGLRKDAAALGEAVYAIGTPRDEKFQGTVTKGVVSASRTYEGLPFIQSDVSINPGNSGGPLLDEAGAVIGVTVSGYQVNGAPVGLNLFIPIGDALDALALKPAT